MLAGRCDTSISQQVRKELFTSILFLLSLVLLKTSQLIRISQRLRMSGVCNPRRRNIQTFNKRDQSSLVAESINEDEMEDKVLPPCTAEGPEGPLTTTLDIVDTSLKIKKWPAFGVLDESGRLRNQRLSLPIDKDLARRMYLIMCRVQALDSIFYDSQRQGRISFYMQSAGEEASIVGMEQCSTFSNIY
jgi:hypothetical protein